MRKTVARRKDVESSFRAILAGCALAMWAAVACADNRASASDSPGPAHTQLRIVYVPRARAVTVKQLAARTEYAASLFDPVDGGVVSPGGATTDEAGSWRCAPPNHKHDWVLVLETHGDSEER
ncbi:MAG: putative collagen-binding domain-containing protein [Planctomycetota bacterium]